MIPARRKGYPIDVVICGTGATPLVCASLPLTLTYHFCSVQIT
jgi:hypothetical protein